MAAGMISWPPSGGANEPFQMVAQMDGRWEMDAHPGQMEACSIGLASI